MYFPCTLILLLEFNQSSLSGFRTPFNVVVHTNSIETTTDGDTNNRGFCLDYVQQPCSTVTGK